MPKSFLTVLLISALAVHVSTSEAQDSTKTATSNKAAQKNTQSDENENPTLKKIKIGSTKNVTQFGNLFTAGQFSKDDIQLLKSKGISTVITLRTDGEVKWDEKGELEKNGIKFVQIPFRAPDTLTDQVFNKVRKVLKSGLANKQKVMLHCGSANRVGAVWAAFRSLDQDLSLEAAIKEGKKVGLRNAGYEAKAKEYINKNKRSAKQKDD